MTEAQIAELERRVGVCLVPREGVAMPSCHEPAKLCCCEVLELIASWRVQREALEYAKWRLEKTGLLDQIDIHERIKKALAGEGGGRGE